MLTSIAVSTDPQRWLYFFWYKLTHLKSMQMLVCGQYNETVVCPWATALPYGQAALEGF